MKYTIVSWNCNGGFRNKFLELLKAYPDADIFVIQECEDPYFYDVEEFKRLFNNGFRIGTKQKGLAVFARDGITLKRLDWPNSAEFSFAPILINGEWNLVAVWTQSDYTEELHDFLDANIEKFESKTLMIGDFNSSVVFDRKSHSRGHAQLVERMGETGQKPLYHHLSGDEQGKEAVPTFYWRRKEDQPFHIDHAFADPSNVVSFEIAPLDTHASWLKLSDHMPIKVVLDTDPQPADHPLPEIEEEAVYVPKRVVRPMSELKKAQEEAAQLKMSIRMPDGTLIRRAKMTDTFRDFIMGMGWEDVRYLNFDVYGQDLITQEHPTGWYKELVPGWYVNTGMKANTMRTTAYEIARALGKKIVVSWD